MGEDITEDEIIRAVRIVDDGGTVDDAVRELYPSTEYPDLTAMALCGHVRKWLDGLPAERFAELFCQGG